MTKLNSDTAPKSGSGSDESRLSQSPQAIRHGLADPTDIHDSKVTSETGDPGLRQEHARVVRNRPVGGVALMAGKAKTAAGRHSWRSRSRRCPIMCRQRARRAPTSSSG